MLLSYLLCLLSCVEFDFAICCADMTVFKKREKDPASATVWCTVMEVPHSDMPVTAVCNHGNIYIHIYCWIVVPGWLALLCAFVSCLDGHYSITQFIALYA